jgi:hypothetical protein
MQGCPSHQDEAAAKKAVLLGIDCPALGGRVQVPA